MTPKTPSVHFHYRKKSLTNLPVQSAQFRHIIKEGFLPPPHSGISSSKTHWRKPETIQSFRPPQALALGVGRVDGSSLTEHESTAEGVSVSVFFPASF